MSHPDPEAVSARRSVWYVFVTLLLAPGLIAHEYAHYIACRILGVPTHRSPSVNLIGGVAYVDHARIESFGSELLVAVAPFVLNSCLAVLAFCFAAVLPAVLTEIVVWIGVCLSLTAVPSDSDTARLFEAADSLSKPGQLLAYFLVAPVRAVSFTPPVTGFVAAAWMAFLTTFVGSPVG